jgi:hypothetical protein
MKTTLKPWRFVPWQCGSPTCRINCNITSFSFVRCYFKGYTTALNANPNHAESLLNRATAYIKLKKYYDALQVCKVSHSAPQPYPAPLKPGLLTLHPQDLNTSVSINPDLELAYYRKG